MSAQVQQTTPKKGGPLLDPEIAEIDDLLTNEYYELIKEELSTEEFNDQFKKGIEYFNNIMTNAIACQNNLDDALFMMFSFMTRRAIFMGNTLAAVALSNTKLEFIYNPIAMLNYTPKDIEFVLYHELGHLLNKHFSRGDSICTTLDISKSEFYKTYSKYADLPINKTLQDHPSYNKMSTDYGKIKLKFKNKDTGEITVKETKGGLLSYASEKIPEEYGTYEQIINHIKEKEKDKESNQDDPTILVVSSNGDITVEHEGSDPFGNVVVIPEAPSDPHGTEKEIGSSMQKALSRSKSQTKFGCYEQKVDNFISNMDNLVNSWWIVLEQILRKLGKSAKCRKQSFRRINKLTKQPPGRIKKTGYKPFFIVDSSGSMSDNEVYFLIDMMKRASLETLSDSIYFAEWTTQLAGEVKIIKNKTDALKCNRNYYGGTNFSKVFNQKEIIDKKPDAYIFATDGEVGNDWPEDNPNVPVFYIITTQHGMENYERVKLNDPIKLNNSFAFYAPINDYLRDKK